MENHNEENKKQTKLEFNGTWMIAIFALLLVSVVMLGKCAL